jgi:hypothetical protein
MVFLTSISHSTSVVYLFHSIRLITPSSSICINFLSESLIFLGIVSYGVARLPGDSFRVNAPGAFVDFPLWTLPTSLRQLSDFLDFPRLNQ